MANSKKTVAALAVAIVLLLCSVFFLLGRGSQAPAPVRSGNQAPAQTQAQTPKTNAPALTPDQLQKPVTQQPSNGQASSGKYNPSIPVEAGPIDGDFIGAKEDNSPRNYPYPNINGEQTPSNRESDFTLFQSYLKNKGYVVKSTPKPLMERDNMIGGYPGLNQQGMQQVWQWRDAIINTLRRNNETNSDVVTDAYLFYVLVGDTEGGTFDDSLVFLMFRRPGQGWEVYHNHIR